jgi:hypothetical protein
MSNFTLKSTHAPVKAYYTALAQFHLHGHKTRFRENFRSFAELCRQSINPDLTDDAIQQPGIPVAAEIEKVIRSNTAKTALTPRGQIGYTRVIGGELCIV